MSISIFLKLYVMREKLLPTQRIKAIQEELARFMLREVLREKGDTMWRMRNAICNLVISM
jgi:hypothetical protein